MPTDRRNVLAEEVFTYCIHKKGAVFISYQGAPVTVLRGAAAAAAQRRLERLEGRALQLEPSYRVYAYGLGLLGPEGFGEAPPTVLTFGGGAGLEFSYLTLFGGDPARVPPLWASLDLGLVNRSLLGEGPSVYFGSGFSFRF